MTELDVLHISLELIECCTTHFLLGQQVLEADRVQEERTLGGMEGSCKSFKI